LLPLALVVIAIQPGTLLGLERGQCDTVLSLLVWTAVLLMAREQLGSAIFCAITAALIKPYAFVFAAGFVAFGLAQRRWRTTAIATGAALGLLLAPLARYLPQSLAAMQVRGDFFWASSANWSLANVSYAIHPSFVVVGRYLFIALCLLASGLAWLETQRAMRDGD
jgi:hypothetical protein